MKEIISRQLHVFADGSSQSCGRSEDVQENVECQLVMAKNKMCPAKKSVTIPHVELSAAVSPARLKDFVKNELSHEIDQIHYWVDSMNTLRYIRNKCRRFKVFVANWVSELQDRTNVEDWHYVNTKENPADLAARPTYLMSEPTIEERVIM